MGQPCVYILQSVKNGRYYVGSTVYLDRRLAEHSRGKDAYTKNIRPLKLMFHQNYSSLAAARRMERKIKSLKRRDFIEKIVCDGVIKMGR